MSNTQQQPKHKTLQPCKNKARKRITASKMLIVNLCNRHTPSWCKFLIKANYNPTISDLPKNTQIPCAAIVSKSSSEVNVKQKNLEL